MSFELILNPEEKYVFLFQKVQHIERENDNAKQKQCTTNTTYKTLLVYVPKILCCDY